MVSNRRSFLGWAVATTSAILIGGAFGLARSSDAPRLRSEHALDSGDVPGELMVIVSDLGKTFHIPSCTFIHAKTKLQTIPSSEAVRLGYVPCVRCMKKYQG